MPTKEIEKTGSFATHLHGCVCSPCMQTRGYRLSQDDESLIIDGDAVNPSACPYESAIFDCPDIQDYLAGRPV
jgi:hypothetical protein